MTDEVDARTIGAVNLDTSSIRAASIRQGKSMTGGRVPQSDTELWEPTPSPLFPPDLTYLTRFTDADTKELLKHYCIVKYKRVILEKTSDAKDAEKVDTSDSGNDTAPRTELVEEPESREESLNRFLSYIGVRLNSNLH
jgi:hypothetical protein